MIPLEPALSSGETASEAAGASRVVRAFLTSVFRRVLMSTLRRRRFSDWRVHFTAALMFGTRRIVARWVRGRPAADRRNRPRTLRNPACPWSQIAREAHEQGSVGR